MRLQMVEIQQSFPVRYDYAVTFTRRAFDLGNPTLRHVLASAGSFRHRVLPVIDSGVLAADTTLAERLLVYADAHADAIDLADELLVVRGGEACKSDTSEVDRLHDAIGRHRLCRHSFVLVIGGGAVLDAMGFAAAVAHRGVRIVRMPTTVLAQNDAGIGVKNAINHLGRKNFLGTFAPPFAVIDDFDFLRTLPARELRSGIAEAVKVALIKDRDFFDHLRRVRRQLAIFDRELLEDLIVRCAELHLEHIRTSGDPFELGSARPLDFGHWAAHRLEELSGAELRHGEAVAIGLALDSLYSQRLGMIGEAELHAILSTLEEIGFTLHHPTLAQLDVQIALANFREHLGGDLCITLLQEIGRGIEVHEIDLGIMRKCVDFLLQRGEAGPC